MERLPLSSVRTFAVVGRLLSISRAAEELEVTPSAVSHHIKTLENYVQTALVLREGNKISLTAAGARYLAQVSDGLLLLSNASRGMKAAKNLHVIRVACPPGLAVLWLIPRVGQFMQQHKHIVVAITSAPNPPALLDSTFDVGFWYGQGVVAGMQLEPLGTNRLFPVCHPQLVDGKSVGLTDLAGFSLLESSDESYYEKMQPRLGWKGWLRAAGVPENPGTRFLNFTPHLLMHRAVEAKLGVGLSRTLLAVDELDAGTLVAPFGGGLVQTANYHLVSPSVIAKRKDVQLFREWVLEQAEESSQKLEKMFAAEDVQPAGAEVERRRATR